MAVYSTTQLIKILNDSTTLAEFPVEGTLSLMFSAPIDEQNIKSFIFITKEKPIQNPINIANNEVRYIGDIGLINAGIVDYNYTVTTSDVSLGSKPIYNITPAEPLSPNFDYWLVVSKSVAPLFYNITKTQSIGPSSANLIISSTASNTVNQTILVTILTNSILGSGGSNTITYSLTVNGSITVANATLETSSQVITLGSGITVKFNSKIPILASEIFNIALSAFTKTGSTQIQKVSTYVDSEVIPVPTDEQTTRIDQQAIINFYELNGYARRIGEDDPTTDSAQPTTSQIVCDVVTRFDYPNVIYIEIGDGKTSFDPTSLTDVFFNFSSGPAFNNYLLQNLTSPEQIFGFRHVVGSPDYEITNQYIVQYKLIENDFGALNTIMITIVEDNSGTVPSGQQLLVQAAP